MIPQGQINEDFPQEWEATMQRIESAIAGGVSGERLRVITGLRQDELDSLLARRLIGGRIGAPEKTGEAMQALADWLREDDSERTALSSGFAATPTFRAIQGIIERAIRGLKLVAIVGGVGIGKSEAGKAYAAKNPRTLRHPGAARIEFRQCDRKPAAALERILSALEGASGRAYRNGQLLDAIGNACRPGDCLILDECNNLQDAAEVARDIHALGIPVVMMGNHDFARAVFGSRSAFAALASRALRHEFPATTEDDVDAWLAWAGLSGADLRRVAVALAARPGPEGGLRSLALLVDTCRDYFPDRSVDGAMLREMARQFHRPC
jgi:hypothetical protein